MERGDNHKAGDQPVMINHHRSDPAPMVSTTVQWAHTVASWRAVRIIGTALFLACAACTNSSCHKDDKSSNRRSEQMPVLTVHTQQLGPGKPMLLSIGVLASGSAESHE